MGRIRNFFGKSKQLIQKSTRKTKQVVIDKPKQAAQKTTRSVVSGTKRFGRKTKQVVIDKPQQLAKKTTRSVAAGTKRLGRKTKQVVVDKPKQLAQKAVQKTKWRAARRRKQLTQKRNDLFQSAKRRFEDSWLFRKYRLPVENSKLFKKLKPVVMKPFLEQRRRKSETEKRLAEIRNAPSERQYQEDMYDRLIKEASALKDAFRRLHDLNAINRRLGEYIETAGKKASAPPPKPARIAKVIPRFRKPAPEATDAQEVAEHLKRLRSVKWNLDRTVEDIAGSHAVEIAKNPNYAWVVTAPRVAARFALAAAKYINETSTAPGKIPPAPDTSNKPKP